MRSIHRLLLVIAGLFLATACDAQSGNGVPPAPLLETRWLMEQVAPLTVEPGIARKEPFLQFHPDKNRYSATAGCNGLGGAYMLDGANLRLEPGISTRMFCDGPVGQWESAMRQAILQTVSWRIDGKTLSLLDAAGTETARFRAASPE